MALSDNATAVLQALRQHAEGGGFIPSDDDEEWMDVYLDNAFGDLPNITNAQRGGYLSALTAAGPYRETDYAFGAVRMEDRP
jgi:hypothetical protein